MKLCEFFTAVQEALPARRGNLYEQHFKREGADGQTKRYGPYYVWTRCEGGRMVSDRIAKKDVARVREEIARGKVLDRLIRQLWSLAEDLARKSGESKKKKPTKSKRQPPPSL